MGSTSAATGAACRGADAKEEAVEREVSPKRTMQVFDADIEERIATRGSQDHTPANQILESS
jgi:hypothetical protein